MNHLSPFCVSDSSGQPQIKEAPAKCRGFFAVGPRVCAKQQIVRGLNFLIERERTHHPIKGIGTCRRKADLKTGFIEVLGLCTKIQQIHALKIGVDVSYGFEEARCADRR